ncbi:glycosyl hydrolase family 7-domain-containing protein [Cladochytrium replicatum]|nr:glycosyl hydrolase family 7-domain-containing protein [Cladochytrium replicatum]
MQQAQSYCLQIRRGVRYKGVCNKDGCDFNAYRQGNKTIYGPSLGVDTSKPFTVVTQFLTTYGTDSGDLSDIRRFYIQGGKVIAQSGSTYLELNGANWIAPGYCTAQKSFYGDTNDFAERWSEGYGTGSRPLYGLVLSIWDDVTVNILGLDSVAFPKDGDPSNPDVARGSCATTPGEPKATCAANQDAYVQCSNIRCGDIGFTNSQDPYCCASSTQQCSGGYITSCTPTSSTTTTSRATSAATSATATTSRAATTPPPPVLPVGLPDFIAHEAV